MDINLFKDKYDELYKNITHHRQSLILLEEQYNKDLQSLIDTFLDPFKLGVAVTFNSYCTDYYRLYIGQKFHIVNTSYYSYNNKIYLTVRRAKANGSPSIRGKEITDISVKELDLWL